MKKKTRWGGFFLLLLTCLAALPASQLLGAEGVALALVYDTSGSMKEVVRDRKGANTPKYVIANRALVAVAEKIRAFSTNTAAGAPPVIHAGLITFTDKSSAQIALPFDKFDAEKFKQWASAFKNPAGGTPLGQAVSLAASTVLRSPLSRKHVLVITDGANTVGPDPGAVLPGLQKEAEKKNAFVSVHFVAFDINAKLFDPLKKLGVNVLGADDEVSLNGQLEFILEEKILLEKETPAKK